MKPPEKTWLRKRKLTTIAFAVQSILIGCEMAITYVNMWIYMETLVKPSHQKFYYSFISLSFVLSAALLSTFISKFADEHRNIRKLFFITNTAYIVGNLIYMLPFSPWLLVAGRLIAGGGVSQWSIMMGELGRCYPKDELTSRISLISMANAFGYIAASAINAAFTSVKYSVGELRITFANISGFYMPALFVGSQIMCFFMVHDLSKEYDLKAQDEKSSAAGHIHNCSADADIELSLPKGISLKLKETKTNEAYTDEHSHDDPKLETSSNEAYIDEDCLNNSHDDRKPETSSNGGYTDEDCLNNSHDDRKPETSTNEAYIDEDCLNNSHDDRKPETSSNEAYTDEGRLNNYHDDRKPETSSNEGYTDENSLNNSHGNRKPKTSTNEAYTDEEYLNNSHDHRKAVAVVKPSRLSSTDVSSNDISDEKINDNEMKNENSLSAPCEMSGNAVETENVSCQSSNLNVEMDDNSTSNNSVQCSLGTSVPPIVSDDLKRHELMLKHYDCDVESSTMEKTSNICDSNNQVEASPLHGYSIADTKVESAVMERIENNRSTQTSNGVRKPLNTHNSVTTIHSDIVTDESDHISSSHSNIVTPEDRKTSVRWLLLEMLTHYDTCILLVVCLFENFLMVTYTLIMPIIVLDILKWSETALNGIIFGQAVSVLFPCLVLTCRKFTDQQIFYFSVGSLAAYIFITSIEIILVTKNEHFILNVALSAVYCVLFSNVTVLKEVFLGGFLIKMISAKYQSVGDSIRLLISRVGAIASMLSSPFLIQRIDIIGSIYIIIMLVLAILLIVRRNTLKTPTIIIQ